MGRLKHLLALVALSLLAVGALDRALGSAHQALLIQANGGSTTQTATPTFSPGGGSYGSTQTVTISDSTPSHTIYYTTNGTTPTTGSTVYSTALSVSTSQQVQAIATASGFTQSAVGSATYTISGGGSPTAPTNLVMSLQALPAPVTHDTVVDPQQYASPFNPPPYINDTGIAWTQGTGGVGGIAYNKVYRSTTSNSAGFSLLYTSSTPITSYLDTAANNSIYYGNSDPNYTGTSYWYKVTAVDTGGNESPQSAAQAYYVYQNGNYNWGVGFASDATLTYNDTTHPQGGHTYDWKVALTATNGYILPYADVTVAKWNQWSGAFNNLAFDIWTPHNGDYYTLYFVRVGDIYIYGPGGSAAGPWTVYTSAFATLVGGQWNHVIVPLSAVINDYGTSGAGPPVMRYATYKFGLQPQGSSSVPGFAFFLDNVELTQ